MKMSSCTELMSHPKKRLEDHLENVANFSKNSFNFLNIENNDLFSKISFIIGLTHDFAKSTSYFQNYLLNGASKANTPHSYLSSIFTYFAVKDYLSKNNINFKVLSIISYIVVLRHHSNLKNVPSELPGKQSKKTMVKNQLNDLKNSNITLRNFYNKFDIDFDCFFDKFEDLIHEIETDLLMFEIEPNSNYYFLLMLFYSILLDADKMDASKTDTIERLMIDENIVDDYKKNKFTDNESDINIIREKAYCEVIDNINNLDLNEKILSINLPTGIGKTLTGFSVALKLKEKINKELNFNPRIIYSLPFLTIIDQNEEVIKDILNNANLEGNNYLLKHNFLSDMNYRNNNEEEYDISNSKLLIEGWNSEIIITTFVQFFNTILSNQNKTLRRFHNLTNSIIILDEIQSIPHKYWKIINHLFKKLTDEYNCYIIIMTATQPLLFTENEIISLVSDVNYYFNQFDRINYNFDLTPQNLDEFKEEVFEKVYNSNKDFMFVLNTINSAIDLYNFIKEKYQFLEKCCDENGIFYINDSTQLIFLSTNIIPKHRLERINKIKNSNKRNIIVTTQLIEAGVDIDVDVVYRDLAPLDSIIQTAGRCNRNNSKEKGEVNIILLNDNRRNYSNYVYDSLLLNTTKELLESFENVVSEKEFNLTASKRYFELLLKRSSQEENLEQYIEYLKFEEIYHNFNLIEEKVPKVDVFIEINSDACDVYKQFKSIINNTSGFERKNEFLKIKSEFYKYIISVPENKIGATNFIENANTFVIENYEIDRKYALDIGFLSQDNENAFII